MPRRKRKHLKLKLRPETMMSLGALFFFLLGILILISFTGQGAALQWLHSRLSVAFGASLLVVPFIFFAAGLVLLGSKWKFSQPHVLLGGIVVFLGWVGAGRTGRIGESLFANVAALISAPGTLAFFVIMLIGGILIVSQTAISDIIEYLSKRFQPKLKDEEEKSAGFHLPKLQLPFSGKQQPAGVFASSPQSIETQDDDDNPLAVDVSQTSAALTTSTDESGQSISTTDVTPLDQQVVWEYPPLALLSSSEGGEAERGDVKKNADIIERTLRSFNIKTQLAEIHYGPSVTQYALTIAEGTKLSKVTGLTTDLALALAAPTGQIRIEAPIAGTSWIGVEVPNYTPSYVTLRKMLSSPEMKKHASKLATALGIDVSGKPVVMDIAKMPHVLIAGATGSGKSVAINAFMCSMLFRASPAEVRFILVDPKQVELTPYNDIPHLLVPVITDSKKVVSALKWAVDEMERRYKLLAQVGVRQMSAYNELAGHAAMYNIVIIIDELADIMLFAPSEVEDNITRIAQKARAVGIHLVLATQRPSVDVITGLIKANIPARLAFNVASMMDSRVILDTPGAEKLLGRGDMLFIPPEQSKPSRIQGTYVSDKEIIDLVQFIKSQGQKPQYEEEIVTKYKISPKGGMVEQGAVNHDELFPEIAQFVASQGKASASNLQRKYSLGYNRAARIMDDMYSMGLIGPQEGSKPREVYTAKVMEYLRGLQGGGNE